MRISAMVGLGVMVAFGGQVGQVGQAFAQEQAVQGPSCQEQLLVKSSHDQLMVEKRAQAEDQLAQVAARAAVMQARIQQLEKEQVTLKAKIAELTPKAPAEPESADK